MVVTSSGNRAITFMPVEMATFIAGIRAATGKNGRTAGGITLSVETVRSATVF